LKIYNILAVSSLFSGCVI